MLRSRFQLSQNFPYWFHHEAFGPGMFSIRENCLVVTKDICDLLKANGLNPNEILARGGFKSKEDIDLILQTGWDYEGRNGFSKRDEATYALPVNEMDFIHRFEDPAHNPLFWIGIAMDNCQYPALVLYDTKKMRLSDNPCYAKAKVYDFLQPDKKKEALVGVIEIEVV